MSNKNDKYYDTLIKDTLHPTFWNENLEFDEDVADRLVIIAKKMYKSLHLDVEIKDIILIGSIANYNWHEESDLDVHVILDYADISYDEELVSMYLDLNRKEWNAQHNIKILDFPVELSFNDISDHINSAGQYSLLNKKWNKKPTKPSELSEDTIEESKKLYDTIATAIDDLEENYKKNKFSDFKIYERAKKIWKIIKRLREDFLEDEGEYGPKNITFKRLRQTGYLDIITKIKTEVQDNILSVYTD